MRVKRVSRSARATLAAATLLAVATACEPAPPPVALEVNTQATGTDAAVGDGVCEATPGAGDCTLDAAIAEGNAHPRAALTVPAGTYTGFQLTVTGNITVNWDDPVDVVLADSTIDIASGGALAADGLRSWGYPTEVPAPVTISVSGSLHLRRSVVDGASETATSPPLTITSGGGAVLDRSVVIGFYGAIVNAGNLIAVQSSVFTFMASPRLTTEPGGSSHLQGTFVSRLANTAVLGPSCAGTPPVSLGGNAFQATLSSGCAATPADLEFFTPSITYVDGVPAPASATVGVDLTPLGQHGCAAGTDLLGNPRVVDGDGDGVVACDAGAVEVPN